MSKRVKAAAFILTAVLLIAALASVVVMKNKFSVTKDYGELKDEAYTLHDEGKYEEAIDKLETYCMYVVTDIDAKTVLGDWYYDLGEEDDAYACYRDAAESKKAEEASVNPLTLKNKSEIMLYPFSEIRLEIAPDVRMTREMEITVTSANLVPEKRVSGKIAVGEKELEYDENYLTTDWFDVNEEGQYLTLSGGFNCAVWQFADKNGIVCNTVVSPNKYRLTHTEDVYVYQMTRVKIPDGAKKCRVTYFDKSREAQTASPEEELTIVYGRMPGASKRARVWKYNIPDLKEGEKLVLDETGWHKVTKTATEDLTEWEIPVIERGSCISVDGTLPGRVSFESSDKAEFSKDGIYTVRFDKNSSSATGERLDDAKNLGFNASVGSGTISLGDNSFDYIYPWKDMKLCAIKNGKITYYGDKEFSTEGDAGDVFVEIPKFFVKRSVDENYDTVSISGEKHEGFEVDPAFVKNGEERDKIYIAAYLSAEGKANEAISAANAAPQLNLSFDEVCEKARAKGEGYSEMDYYALAALQKLFMVETGLRNSQYLYMGICGYYTDAVGENGQCLTALESKNKTNSITVSSECQFTNGNNVAILQRAEDVYDSDKVIAAMRKVKTVRQNSDDTQTVFFDGDAINVTKNKTAIVALATNNGSTASVEAHTGALDTTRGTIGFKYRHIENLWGNAYVYIDKVTVTNGTVRLTKRDGGFAELGYMLPVSENGDCSEAMIKEVGYDENNPSVMLPSIVSGDVSTSTFYGDCCLGDKSDKECVLRYGGSWKTGGGAGLFAFEANTEKSENRLDTAGRMMYIK